MSSARSENPFERFDIDPIASVDEITDHMRELAKEAPESQRQVVRDSWEALTLQPQRRIAAALSTFIEREPARVAPPSQRTASPETSGSPASPAPSPSHAIHLELAPARDLAATPATDPLLESLRT